MHYEIAESASLFWLLASKALDDSCKKMPGYMVFRLLRLAYYLFNLKTMNTVFATGKEFNYHKGFVTPKSLHDVVHEEKAGYDRYCSLLKLIISVLFVYRLNLFVYRYSPL